jgi:quercetin dioxygenase-like cupin family protein
MTASAERRPESGANAGILKSATEIERRALGPNEASFPLAGAETGGVYSLTDFTMAPPPAPGPPAHIHDDADECVYLLEGTLEMGVGDEVITGGAGSVMLVPRGTIHSLVNVGDAPARFIVLLSPPGYEGFWREMSELRARLGGAPDPDTVMALQLKYHMRTGGEARQYE